MQFSPDAIPGFDYSAGLRSVRGKTERLITFLKRFGQEHGNDSEHIQNLLATGALEDAQRMAHTLKGIAGTIGLVRVQQSAQQLEMSLRHQDPEETVSRHLDTLEQQLVPLVDILQELAASTAPSSPVDWPSLKPRLDALQYFLQTDDLEAAGLFEQLRAEINSNFGKDGIRLARMIDSFAFEDAAHLLGELIRHLSQELDHEEQS